jgi:hypothetical protein
VDKEQQMKTKAPKVGDAVIFIDSHRIHYNALVTNTFGTVDEQGMSDYAGCNLVYVSGDESKTDGYGRQMERATSTVHLNFNPAKAYCWCWPDEVK